MKKNLNPFKILLPVLVLLQFAGFAQDDNEKENKKYEFVKTKNINKAYNVSVNDKLSIDNSFGKVEVHTWDKNEIKVDVTIEVSANREDLAQKIFEGITVNDSQNGKDIVFKTKINGNNNSKGGKSTMRVNYSIFMPSSSPLKVVNDFGSTIIPEYKGGVELESKFGTLTAGNLSNVKRIQIEFGKGKLENITNGNIIIKYSKASFGKLMGNVKMNIEFSSGIKMNLDNALTGLDIKSSYSTINIKPSGDLGASYTIATSFGSLKNNTAIKFDGENDENDKGSKFDHLYTGKAGNGAVSVKVTTSFGSVILGEPGPDDMKNKDKSKNKAI